MAALISQTLCDRARNLSKVHCEETVRALTGISSASLWRIRQRNWEARSPGFKRRPMPTDFAIQVNHMTSDEMAAHYHASNTTVARWKRELRR